MIKLFLVLFFSVFAIASGGSVGVIPDITFTWVGFSALAIFVIGYYFVAMEEKYHIDKAKPALLIGTFMFMLIAIYYAINGMDMHLVHTQAQHLILEIAEIFFF
ncbi:MAG: sodium:proton antiporter, partial [Arcobacteraceae bacterium]|nr:sodium:proton antiporter [Arcobacteraceae bacterium]